jgi:hypothetical protein
VLRRQRDTGAGLRLTGNALPRGERQELAEYALSLAPTIPRQLHQALLGALVELDLVTRCQLAAGHES